MGLNFDPPSWLSQLGALVTAGGGSVVVVKLIERAFARDDRQANDRTAISAELRQDLRDLKAEVRELRDDRDKLADECADLRAQLREMRVENIGLRERYHEFSSFAGVLVGTIEVYHTRLGLPDSERIKVPEWVYRQVPGPTARQGPPEAAP
jgi:predicted nuclease with TOPRIM domain